MTGTQRSAFGRPDAEEMTMVEALPYSPQRRPRNMANSNSYVIHRIENGSALCRDKNGNPSVFRKTKREVNCPRCLKRMGGGA